MISASRSKKDPHIHGHIFSTQGTQAVKLHRMSTRFDQNRYFCPSFECAQQTVRSGGSDLLAILLLHNIPWLHQPFLYHSSKRAQKLFAYFAFYNFGCVSKLGINYFGGLILVYTYQLMLCYSCVRSDFEGHYCCQWHFERQLMCHFHPVSISNG
jgi:hypothetical protein